MRFCDVLDLLEFDPTARFSSVSSNLFYWRLRDFEDVVLSNLITPSSLLYGTKQRILTANDWVRVID